MKKYILVDYIAVECISDNWAEVYSDGRDNTRRIALNAIAGEEIYVSTVFLGMDHSYGGSKPLLFETMIIGYAFQKRYSTWDEACEGHNAMRFKCWKYWISTSHYSEARASEKLMISPNMDQSHKRDMNFIIRRLTEVVRSARTS